jgi:aminoglycoside phosphotransferase (APT) family kinase protein
MVDGDSDVDSEGEMMRSGTGTGLDVIESISSARLLVATLYMPHYRLRMGGPFGVGMRTQMTTESLETLQHIVELTFGQHARSMRPIAAGTVNRTVRIELEDSREFILRIAPSPAEAAAGPSWLTANGLRREQSAIDLLGAIGHLLPVTVAHDFTRGSIGCDWVIQEIIPGVPLSSVESSLTSSARIDLWRQLGEVTSRIHDVTEPWFGPPSEGPRFPTWSDLILDDIAGFADDARRWNLATDSFDALADLVESARGHLNAVPPVLIHSDLSLDHVFVEQIRDDWRITGLIDLEFARFADPLSEGLLLDVLQREDEEARAYLEGYGGRPDSSPVRLEIATRLISAWAETDRARLAAG